MQSPADCGRLTPYGGSGASAVMDFASKARCTHLEGLRRLNPRIHTACNVPGKCLCAF